LGFRAAIAEKQLSREMARAFAGARNGRFLDTPPPPVPHATHPRRAGAYSAPRFQVAETIKRRHIWRIAGRFPACKESCGPNLVRAEKQQRPNRTASPQEVRPTSSPGRASGANMICGGSHSFPWVCLRPSRREGHGAGAVRSRFPHIAKRIQMSACARMRTDSAPARNLARQQNVHTSEVLSNKLTAHFFPASGHRQQLTQGPVPCRPAAPAQKNPSSICRPRPH